MTASSGGALSLGEVLGPLLLHQRRHGRGFEPGHPAGREVGVLAQDALGEQADVEAALAEGRQGHGAEQQPLEQPRPEHAIVHQLAEVQRRADDQAHVGAGRAAHLLVQQRFEDGLGVDRQLAHLLDEQGAPVGAVDGVAQQGGRVVVRAQLDGVLRDEGAGAPAQGVDVRAELGDLQADLGEDEDRGDAGRAGAGGVEGLAQGLRVAVDGRFDRDGGLVRHGRPRVGWVEPAAASGPPR